MPAGSFPEAPPLAGSPASLSRTVKQSDFLPPLPATPTLVSTFEPRGLASRNDTPSNPKAPPEVAQLSPREQFAKYYGFSLPPPPPQPDGDPVVNHSYNGLDNGLDNGLVNRSYNGLVKPNPHTIKTSSYQSSSPSEGWKDGSTCSICRQNLTSSPLLHGPPRQPKPYLVSSAAAPFPPPSDFELLAKFNEQFVHSQIRFRSVKSMPSRWEAPSTGRFSLTPSTLHRFNRRDVFTWVTLQQPSFTTRPWSYDSVQTYPAMQLPSQKENRVIKKIVEGQEVEVEIEVEVDEKPKKLFNFAPKVVLSTPSDHLHL